MTHRNQKKPPWPFLFCLVLLTVATTGLAQSAQSTEKTPFAFFEHFGNDQGVTDKVRLIRQDSQGYLWCVVQRKGLLRFDGVKFRAYANDPDDPNSLPSNSIEDMLVDHNGLIWLATLTGIVCFDPVSGRFSSVASQGAQDFTCLFQDHHKRIWAGSSSEGLTFFDAQIDSMVPWPSKHIRDGYTGRPIAKTEFSRISNIAESADGMLWCSTRNGLTGASGIATIDPLRRGLMHFSAEAFLKTATAAQTVAPFMLTLLLDEKKRSVWVGGYGPGLLECSMETHAWRCHDLNPAGQNDPLSNFIYAIQPKNDSTLWLATDTGLKIFSTVRNTWTSFPSSPTQFWEAQNVIHLAVFKDRTGTTWFGTDNGMSRLDPYRQQFALHSPLTDGFNSEAMAEYAPTGEQLFAAWNEDGYFQVFARHERTNKIRQNRQKLLFSPHEVPVVRQIFVAPDDRIWVLLDRGIGWLDPVTLRLTLPDRPIANDPGVRTINLWPRQITAEADRNLWITTFGNGVIRFTCSDGQFWRLPPPPGFKKQWSEFNGTTTSIFCDAKGQIFFGVNGVGLQMWNQTTQAFTFFQPQGKNNRSFGGRFTSCISPDAAGNLWIGTEGGLCRYLPDAAPDSAFERVLGLSEWAYRIVPDVQGQLWLTTGKGLVCYNPQRKIWRKFSEKEGLVLPVTEHIPLFSSSDGQIWLGDDLHFDPAHFVLDPPAAVPVITGFKVYNHPFPLAPPTEQDGQQVFPEIRLGADQEVFTIEIGTLGFTAPEQTQLLYRLRADDLWQEAGAQRAFTFNRLPGGRYRFELKAIAPDGQESGRSVVLPLRVVPPFYRAVWFWLLCMGAFGSGLYALFRYREIQRLRQEQLRLRIARDLHDEVGSTLSSISILSESALRSVEKDLDAVRFGNIGDKARVALDSMSDIVWTINPQNDPMHKVLARMSAYASEMLENVGTELRMEVAEGLESLTLPMEKRKDFYLIFKEAIHNCAKYAGARQVEVAVRKAGNTLILSVKDDGVGFEIQHIAPEARNLGGNGLHNMRSRAAAMGGAFGSGF